MCLHYMVGDTAAAAGPLVRVVSGTHATRQGRRVDVLLACTVRWESSTLPAITTRDFPGTYDAGVKQARG